MTVEEWLGKENQIGLDIWHKKYQWNNESFDEWLQRVSGEDDEVQRLIKEKKFLFAGRILANRGLNKQGKKITLSNCYVITPPEDNIESIFDCAKKLARTYSYGGGCGVDISKLAPRGAAINNAAKETSGAVSFMDLYSMVTGLIGQEGRRGALMISLDCNHPDLEEFISIKADLNRVTKANISIRITDDFMRAVENNSQFTLQYIREATGEVIEKVVNAREVFLKIAEMNWRTAEPGVLFWDKIKNWNLLSGYNDFEFAGVNPCFTGDMTLLTSTGYKRFDELCGSSFKIVAANGMTSAGKVWKSGHKDIVKIIYADGSFITCTPDHIFLTTDGDECVAKNLKHKRIMPFLPTTYDLNPTYIKLGFIQGDGQLRDINDKLKNCVIVNIGKKDGEILESFMSDEISIHDRSITLYGYNELIKSLGFSLTTLQNRVFPSTYRTWDLREKRSFLHGCYSANGSVIKDGRIAYKTICFNFASQLVETLSNDFGIASYITTNKPTKVKFANGEYLCKESYDVNICRYGEILKFAREIGFFHNYKTNNMNAMLVKRAPFVYAVQPAGSADVYDFTEPETHWGVVNGVIAHNCAEEPLPAGGSCLLGSLNLSEFVTNPFTKEAKFDYESFNEAVHVAVRALNNVLDEGQSLHPLEEQQNSVRDWRQIGLGIMGLADMLIKLGYKYGGIDSLRVSKEISFALINLAALESANLSKQFGHFPKFDLKKTQKSDFYQNVLDKAAKYTIELFGLRNSQLLTTAPTGTLSTMLGVSGGIEPIFANSYTRKTETLNSKDTFYKIYTPIVEQYITQVLHSDPRAFDERELPDYFVTSERIPYVDRIGMQGIWQYNIDASISSTVNLPESSTIEDVAKLYTLAWTMGLKGITVYRANCERSGILTTETPKKESKKNFDIVSASSLPRGMIEDVPKGLTYRKYKIKSACGSLYLFVGLDENEGKIYDFFTNTDGVGGCTVSTQANSRLMSACVRGGIPVEYVIEQLSKSGTCPSFQYARGKGQALSKGRSCPSAISHILQEILDEFKSDAEEAVAIEKECKPVSSVDGGICPECGQLEVVHEAGCLTCKNCGWSKCS